MRLSPRVLKRLLNWGMLGIAGILGALALLVASTPVLKAPREEAWHAIGPLDGFPVGSVRAAILQRSPIA